jgi:hypothetical protein
LKRLEISGEQARKVTSRVDWGKQERRKHMHHNMIQQEEQSCLLQEDRQPFIEEIVTLRSLAEEAGVTGHLLEELDDFKHDIEYLDASEWRRKEVRVLNRNILVSFSLAALRAYRSRSCGVE